MKFLFTNGLARSYLSADDLVPPSASVTFDSNDQNNIFLVASKDIAPGEFIFDAMPMVHYTEPRFHLTVCSHCLKESGKPLKQCGKCEFMRYCSIDCQRASWSLHKYECGKSLKYTPSEITAAARMLYKKNKEFKNKEEEA